MKSNYRVLFDGILPVAILFALTIPFWTSDLDLAASEPFYTPGAGWERGGDQPWQSLYDFGVVPAWVVALGALAVFIASFRVTRAKPYRRAAIFLVLAMAIGPGLIVNEVFKENWGRPRPRDVYEFGGDRSYVKPLLKSPPQNGNSFASGHASTAFYLLVPYFLLRRKVKSWAVFFVLLGLAYGSIVGLARMTQGAHFLSDVLWALGIVYLTAVALYYLLGLHRHEPES